MSRRGFQAFADDSDSSADRHTAARNRATLTRAGDHQVALGDNFFDREPGIRESGKEAADMFLFAISATLLIEVCGVVVA